MMEASAFRVVVQARTRSTRLPGKMLLPLGGIPTAVLVCRRAANCGHEVVAAIPDLADDDELATLLEGAGIRVVRGSEKDVLARVVLACDDLSDDAAVIRLTADNVIPDGTLVSGLAEAFDGDGYMAITWPDAGAPYGVSAEAFTVNLLRRAYAETASPRDREHVTPWIRRNSRVQTWSPPGLGDDMSHVRCTLDTISDYTRLQDAFADVNDVVGTPWSVLVDAVAASFPESHIPIVRNWKGGIGSEMTLGTAQIGLDYGCTNTTGMLSEGRARDLLFEAWRHGIRQFDCARAYGVAETRVGALLNEAQISDVDIITKLSVEHEPAHDASSDWVQAWADASVLRSCRELGRSNLDTLLLHRWSQRHSWDGAVWERLQELRAEGVIGRLGASVRSIDEARQALSDPGIEHIQLPVNVLDHRWSSAGIGRMILDRPEVTVHARSVFLQGILLGDESVWPSLPGVDAAEWNTRLDNLVKELGLSGRLSLAVGYVRALPWVDSLVIGLTSIPELKEVVDVWQDPLLGPDERKLVEQRLAGAPGDLLDPNRWS